MTPAGTPIERAAFDAFYRKHFRFVWNAVRRIRVPTGTEDDVLQDVFVEAVKSIQQGVVVEDAPGWLYGITRNIARSHWRKNHALEPLPTAAESGDFELATEPTMSPEALSQQSQERGILHSLLVEVADENRQAFELVEIDGLTAVEASTLLEVPVNTIYSRVRRGKEQLLRAHRAHTEAP